MPVNAGGAVSAATAASPPSRRHFQLSICEPSGSSWVLKMACGGVGSGGGADGASMVGRPRSTPIHLRLLSGLLGWRLVLGHIVWYYCL